MTSIDLTAHAPHHEPADLERYRPRIFGVAYRMLGDVHEAQDIVQETFLRWHQADRISVRAPEGWLVSVATRLGIDRLRRARTEREAYTGPWLPVPVDAAESADRRAELASDLSMAFLVLLERLGAEERAAFLLREVFDAPYDEIARVIEKSEAATRQIVHRARERVRADRTRFVADREARDRLLDRFLAAIQTEDRDALLELFADDATFTSDGGGKISAARRTVVGRDRVTRFLLGVQAKWGTRTTHRLAVLNGERCLVTLYAGGIFAVTALATDGKQIVAAYRVLNPDKLRHLSL